MRWGVLFGMHRAQQCWDSARCMPPFLSGMLSRNHGRGGLIDKNEICFSPTAMVSRAFSHTGGMFNTRFRGRQMTTFFDTLMIS